MYQRNECRRETVELALLTVGIVLAIFIHPADLLARGRQPAHVRPLAVFEDSNRTVLALAFSPDGQTLASGGRSRWIQLRSIESGKVERTFECPIGGVADITFSPDGKLLGATYFHRMVQILDYRSGTTIHLFEVPKGHERRIAFSNDNRIFATAGRDSKVKLWDVRSGKLLRATPPQTYSAADVAFSPDGKAFATVTGEWLDYKKPGETKLWETESVRELALLEKHTLEIKGVFFDQKGERLFTFGPGGMRIWHVGNKQQLARLATRSCFISAVLLPDQLHVATGSSDGKVEIWNSKTSMLVTRFAGHPGLIQRVAVSPDGSLLASAGKEGSLRFWATGLSLADDKQPLAADLVRQWPEN